MSEPLTPRERQVCDLITRGIPGKEIATLLSISYRTVESHRRMILVKCGVRNVAALTRLIVTAELTTGATE